MMLSFLGYRTFSPGFYAQKNYISSHPNAYIYIYIIYTNVYVYIQTAMTRGHGPTSFDSGPHQLLESERHYSPGVFVYISNWFLLTLGPRWWLLIIIRLVVPVGSSHCVGQVEFNLKVLPFSGHCSYKIKRCLHLYHTNRSQNNWHFKQKLQTSK